MEIARGCTVEPPLEVLRISREARLERSRYAFHPHQVPCAARYIVGAALIASPWIFQYSEHTAVTIVPAVLGIGLIVYSLFTNYELGVWKLAPMAVHNLIDIVAGTVLALSPWIFGYANDSTSAWILNVVIGLAAVFLGLTTKQSGGYSYGRSEHPATG
jgi:hypothetical protein